MRLNAFSSCIVRFCRLFLHNLNEMHRCTMHTYVGIRILYVHTSTFPLWLHLSIWTLCRCTVVVHIYVHIWKDSRYSTYKTALNTNKLEYAYTHPASKSIYSPCSGTLFQYMVCSVWILRDKHKASIALKFNVLSVKQTCTEWGVLNVASN